METNTTENKRYKILLVEDDKFDQLAFKRSVEGENLLYNCTTVESVSEARTILDSEWTAPQKLYHFK